MIRNITCGDAIVRVNFNEDKRVSEVSLLGCSCKNPRANNKKPFCFVEYETTPVPMEKLANGLFTQGIFQVLSKKATPVSENELVDKYCSYFPYNVICVVTEEELSRYFRGTLIVMNKNKRI